MRFVGNASPEALSAVRVIRPPPVAEANDREGDRTAGDMDSDVVGPAL